MLDHLISGLSDPATLFGHFTYLLLVASVMMRRMVALRLLAVAAGLSKIIYRAFLLPDPVSVLWETIFVLVNVIQLLVIWYYDHHHRFTTEQRHFAANMPKGVDRGAIKRLVKLSTLEQHAVGDSLTTEGEPVRRLMYLAEGVVKIERAGRLVAICGPGDYIGELSFLSHIPATATATVVKPARILAFDQARLNTAIQQNMQVQHTLEAALNRNLAGKLARSNDGAPAENPAPSV